MKLITLLLSLTLVADLQSTNVKLTNNCGYRVHFAKQWFGLTFPVMQAIEKPYYVDAKSSQIVENNRANEEHAYSIRAGCANTETNCSSGQPPSTCVCDSCCSKFAMDTTVHVSIRYSQFYTHTYYIFNIQGYNIPVQVSPTGTGADKCKIIKCNVTLDECPDNENYGIGDLRVMKGNHTVSCVSPCTKLSYPPPNGQGLPRYHCTKEKFSNLKYMELMDRKCLGYNSHYLKTPFDKITVKTK